MKKILLSAIILFSAACATAQARLSAADYNKVLQPAVEIEIPFNEKTVMKTIVDNIEKRGYRGKDSKGYTVFKGVLIPEIGPAAYDLYFKTDRKSRKEKDITILTMLISSGFERFIGDTTDSKVIDNAKAFLNKQVDAVIAYDLELQVKEQDDVAAKADKKYNNLVEDGNDLAKKKEKLEKDIAENIQKQAEQKAEAEKQRQILETLKAKRKQ